MAENLIYLKNVTTERPANRICCWEWSGDMFKSNRIIGKVATTLKNDLNDVLYKINLNDDNRPENLGLFMGLKFLWNY